MLFLFGFRGRGSREWSLIRESFVKFPLVTPGRKWEGSSLLRGSSAGWNNTFLWRPVMGKGKVRIHARKVYGET
jgi:hypothetical protein